MVPIPSTVQDPNYRWVMPRMQIKQESRLNGAKVNIVNVEDVGKSLRVPGDVIMKFMCADLGAAQEKKSIIKGDHKQDVLIKTLDKFIEKFLLCQKCSYPEIVFGVANSTKKGGDLVAKCRSCGNNNKVEKSGKVSSFMVKYLKSNEAADEVGKDKRPKDESKKEEEEKKEEAEEDGPPEVEELGFNSPEIEDALSRIRALVKDKSPSCDELKDEIRNLQIALKFNADLKYYIALNGLFEKDIVKNFMKYKALFAAYLASDGLDGQKDLLLNIVVIFVKFHPELLKFAPTFMKQLYDAELFTENFLLRWHNEEIKLNRNSSLYKKKYISRFRETVEEFIAWLEDAEEESDDEEDDDPAEETKKDNLTEKERQQLELI